MTSENNSKNLRELQILEHTLQQVLMQKQTLDLERSEILNALRELEKSSEEVYRVIGQVMLRSDKLTLKKELEEKKKIVELRISAVDKQETLIEMKASELQKNLSSISSEKKVKYINK